MLPESIKNSRYLNPHHLSQLEQFGIPAVDPSYNDDTLNNIVQYYSLCTEELEAEVHKYAARLLTEGKVGEAWQVLLTIEIV